MPFPLQTVPTTLLTAKSGQFSHLASLARPSRVAAVVPSTASAGIRLAATPYTDPAFNPQALITGDGANDHNLRVLTLSRMFTHLAIWPLFRVSGAPSWTSPPSFIAYGEFEFDPPAGVDDARNAFGETTSTFSFVFQQDPNRSNTGSVWLPLTRPVEADIEHQFNPAFVFRVTPEGSSVSYAYLPPVLLQARGARRLLVVPTHAGGATATTHGTNVSSYVLFAAEVS